MEHQVCSESRVELLLLTRVQVVAPAALYEPGAHSPEQVLATSPATAPYRPAAQFVHTLAALYFPVGHWWITGRRWPTQGKSNHHTR